MKLPKWASHPQANAPDPSILGNSKELYRPDHWLPADRIPVNGFRQVFVWPLAPNAAALNRESVDPVGEFVRDIRRTLERDEKWDASWALNDHLDKAPGQSGKLLDAEKFAEQVFFHDFIQESQFSAQQSKAASAVQLFRRRDISSIEVILERDGGRAKFDLSVDRHNLYLFESGAAILALEVASDEASPISFEALNDKGKALKPRETRQSLRLSDVQHFADHFRRIYAPFFGTDASDKRIEEKKGWVGRRVPISVVLKGKGGEIRGGELKRNDPLRTDPQSTFARLKAEAAPPVFAHWQERAGAWRRARYSIADFDALTVRRGSRRQRKSFQNDVVSGSLLIEGDLAPLWPILLLGQTCHVGRGATVGFGRYVLEDA